MNHSCGLSKDTNQNELRSINEEFGFTTLSMAHIPGFLVGYQQLIKLGIAVRDNDVGEKAVHLVGCFPDYCQI